MIVSFEGNIAVGKTTLQKKLSSIIENKNDIDFIEEPVDEWLNIKDETNNILDVYYNDMKRWSYTFQNIVYITRMNKIIKKLLTSNSKYIFTDRSLQCDVNVFAKMLYDDGKMNKIEWLSYNKLNEFYNNNFNNEVMYIVYLKCDPKVAFRRMKKRNRSSEQDVELEYLQKVDKYHNDWINNIDKSKYKVLILDCNKDFENDKDIFNDMYKQFIDFINITKLSYSVYHLSSLLLISFTFILFIIVFLYLGL